MATPVSRVTKVAVAVPATRVTLATQVPLELVILVVLVSLGAMVGRPET
jgi:hypothetical protein